MIQKKPKFLFIIILSIYAAIMMLGMQTHSMAMEHGAMVKCPFMNEGGSVCQTNAPEYVAHWLIVFAAILSPLLIAFCAPIMRNRLRSLLQAQDNNLSPPFFKLYSKRTPNIQLFNLFIFVFSRGILHARIYA